MAITSAEARKSLESRGFMTSYVILGSYQTNVKVREHAILLDGKKVEGTWQEIREAQVPPQDLVRRLHFEQLELLTHICMFVEDFAYLAYALKHHPRSLHWPIFFSGRTRVDVLRRLPTLHGNSLRARFRLPRIPVLGLGNETEKLVRDVFAQYQVGVRRDLALLAEFDVRGFFRIYNEYKHTFDVFTGTMGDATNLADSVIVVRTTRRRRRGRPVEETILLDASENVVAYYHSVFSAVSNLINCLLSNTLDYMLYADGRYLIELPTDYGIPQEQIEAYSSLPDTLGLHWSNSHESLPSFRFGEKVQSRAETELAEKNIFNLEQPLIPRGAHSVHFGIDNK